MSTEILWPCQTTFNIVCVFFHVFFHLNFLFFFCSFCCLRVVTRTNSDLSRTINIASWHCRRFCFFFLHVVCTDRPAAAEKAWDIRYISTSYIIVGHAALVWLFNLTVLRLLLMRVNVNWAHKSNDKNHYIELLWNVEQRGRIVLWTHLFNVEKKKI